MKLLTKDLATKLVKAHAMSRNGANPDPMVLGKFFNPCGSQTWYLLEFDGEDRLFTYVTGMFEDELGYTSLSELAAFRGRFGLGIERDLYFRPRPLSEVKDAIAARGVA